MVLTCREVDSCLPDEVRGIYDHLPVEPRFRWVTIGLPAW